MTLTQSDSIPASPLHQRLLGDLIEGTLGEVEFVELALDAGMSINDIADALREARDG